MINKCFLHIDDYPRQASDVPFDIAIDWGDGSDIETYTQLIVDKVPPFDHIYNDELSHNIEVTITNSCGAVTKAIKHAPYVLPACECVNEVVEQVIPEIEVSSCFTDIEYDQYITSSKLVVDVVSEVPLVADTAKYEELPVDVFKLVEYGVEDIVENPYKHVMNGAEVGHTPFIPSLTDEALEDNGGAELDGFVYKVSSSNDDNNAWRAFDGVRQMPPSVLADPSDFAWTHEPSKDGNYYGTLTIDIGESTSISSYSLERIGGTSIVGNFSSSLKSWELQGSNDGANWSIIDVQTVASDAQIIVSGVDDWDIIDQLGTQALCIFSKGIEINPVNQQPYRYYRLAVTEIYPNMLSNPPINVSGLQLYGYDNRPTLVKEAETEFAYSFRPSYINRIVLTGDAEFKQRAGNTGFDWQQNASDSEYFDTKITVGRVTDSIRLGLSAGEEAVYHSIKIYDTQAGLLDEDRNLSTSVYSLFAKDLLSGRLRVLAGASGSLIYRSELQQLLGRVIILCNENARVRLLNEGFEWSSEEVDGVFYWRGVQVITDPQPVTEYVLNFNGKTDEDKPIGDGIIRSVSFYTIHPVPSPITVEFNVPPTSVLSEEVSYYLDDLGRYHCVLTHLVSFTDWDLAAYQEDTGFLIRIDLPTEQERLTADYYAMGCPLQEVMFSVGPGGGGSCIYPSINPQDSDNLTLSCEMASHFITQNGGTNFTNHRFWKASKFSYNPHDENIVYAYNQVQVYISHDKGQTFDYFAPKASAIDKEGTVGEYGVAHTMPTGDNHSRHPRPVYKVGQHFIAGLTNINSVDYIVQAVYVHPTDPDTIYIYVQGYNALSPGQIYKTVDGGETFDHFAIVGDTGSEFSSSGGVCISQSNTDFNPEASSDYAEMLLVDDILYLLGGYGLFVADAQGDTVAEVKFNNRHGQLVDEGNPVPTVYVINEDGSLFQKSIDICDSWTTILDGVSMSSSGAKAAFWNNLYPPNAPGDESEVYDVRNAYNQSQNAQVQFLQMGVVGTTHWLAFSRKESNSNPSGILVSHESGAQNTFNWVMRTGRTRPVFPLELKDPNGTITYENVELMDLLPVIGAYYGSLATTFPAVHMTVSRGNPNHVIFGNDCAAAQTLDGGHTWYDLSSTRQEVNEVPVFTTTGLSSACQESLAIDPEDPYHQYAGWTDIGLWESYDGGKSWASVFGLYTSTQGYSRNIYALGIAPDNPNIVLAGGSFTNEHRGLKFNPGRNSFTEIYNTAVTEVLGLPSGVTVPDPRLPNPDIEKDGVQYYAPDSYGSLVPNPNPDPLKGGEPYEKPTSGGSLWRTSDGGNSWHRPAFYDTVSHIDMWTRVVPSDLVFDPNNAGHVYLSTFGMGVFKSTDYGEFWEQMSGIAMQEEHDKSSQGMIVRRLILGQDGKTLFALLTAMDISPFSSWVAPVYYLDLESGSNEWTELNRPNETLSDWYEEDTPHVNLYKGGTMFSDVERGEDGTIYAATPVRARKNGTDPGGTPGNEYIYNNGTYIGRIADGECGGCWASTDMGQTWTQLYYETVTCNAVKLDTRNPNRLYMTALGRVFVSYKGKDTQPEDWIPFEWEVPHRELRYLFEDPLRNNRLFVASNGSGTWSVPVPPPKEL